MSIIYLVLLLCHVLVEGQGVTHSDVVYNAVVDGVSFALEESNVTIRPCGVNSLRVWLLWG